MHLVSTSRRPVLQYSFLRKPSSRFPLRLSHTLDSLIALPPSAFSFFLFPRLYPDLPSSDCTPLPRLLRCRRVRHSDVNKFYFARATIIRVVQLNCLSRVTTIEYTILVSTILISTNLKVYFLIIIIISKLNATQIEIILRRNILNRSG